MLARSIALWLSSLTLAAAASASSAQPTPSLGVAARDPLTIRGVAFAAGERVVVRVATSDRTASRRSVVSDAGTFRVRFVFGLTRCQRLSARAFGSSGSRATLRPALRIDCVPENA